MTPAVRGIAVAVLHICLVAMLGGKLLYDRSTLPSVWVQATPHDPDLPIRGRYVSLDLIVEARGIKWAGKEAGWQPPQSVVLRVEGGRLVAEPKEDAKGYDPDARHVRIAQRRGEKVAVLIEPVSFFISEHVPDPSLRPPGEELLVQVTLPKKGAPRPIRLGVRRGTGAVEPLDFTQAWGSQAWGSS